MLQSPSEVVRDLVKRREDALVKQTQTTFEKGLFSGLKVALAQMFAQILTQVKKHTFTVKVDNQIKLPEIQKVEDRNTVLGLDAVEKSVRSVQEEVSTLTKEQKKALGELAKILKPEKVDFAAVVKAIQAIKIPETKIPEAPKEISVKNLDELKKPLAELASKLKIEFPAINIPEFPKSVTVGNLATVEAILAEISTKTEEKEEKPIGISWKKDKNGKLESLTEVYPSGKVVSTGWNIGSVKIHDDRTS